MNGIDPLDRLLDEVRPPPLPADFAARIVARATAQPEVAPGRPPRDRRGAWTRRHRTLATFLAANLLVASAVAAAIVSGQGIEPLRKVPLIAPVIERIAPRHKQVVHVAAHHPRAAAHPAAIASLAPKPVVPSAVAAAPPPLPAPMPLPMREQQLFARHAALAGLVQRREAAGLPVPPRLRGRVELQDLRRQAIEHRMAGEPVPPTLRRQIARHQLALAPPAVRQSVRETIRERRAAGEPIPPLPELLREARPGGPAPPPDRFGPSDVPAFPSYEEWAAERHARLRPDFQTPPNERRRLWRQRREAVRDLDPDRPDRER